MVFVYYIIETCIISIICSVKECSIIDKTR